MQKSKKQIISDENKKEIFWNIINSLLAGGLVFFGSLTNGEITQKGVCIALMTSLIVAITKFKEYWSKEENEYKKRRKVNLFNFIEL